jgi:sulfite reductase alpha subunit-like flavoprotein
VEEYADEIFDLLDNGAHMYFCGLKGMMPGIQVCRALLGDYGWETVSYMEFGLAPG